MANEEEFYLGMCWRLDDRGVEPRPAERAAAIEFARGRLDELNKVTRAYGRPFHPAASLPEAIEAMPDGWFSSWHPAT
ncbi:hypothetical protein [Streptomyces malaysiensis]|uniref:Uncharacterized protein n=1 Tax=Streptomyces malaysiensis TaxID=92644 RepID=A0A2J7Z1H5_STRMQ|nr:hypothetical protein [Streptomyces malaysiensis]PNG94125.1 hypothetical protein SMF913_10150 [Streptomyces malaysiensis]